MSPVSTTFVKSHVVAWTGHLLKDTIRYMDGESNGEWGAIFELNTADFTNEECNIE